MGLASAAGNIYFVYSFIKRLATPFKSTKAFELGIIDENGKVLKKRSKLKTKEEKESYTLSDTLVFNLKKVLAKVPGGSTKFASFAAALFLMKEENKNAKLYYDQTFLEKEYIAFLQECKYNKKEVSQLIEEVELEMYEELNELAAGGGAIAGIGVENPTKPGQAEPGIRKKKIKKGSKFAGSEVFMVKPETFMRARYGKRQYAKYEHYVGNDETGEAIRQYGRANPGKPIVLQDELTGSMIYLKYGRKYAGFHGF
tara:strand:- start:163 stop:930 length:768 start_codon:yes stop_codon:yes gene_type:complete